MPSSRSSTRTCSAACVPSRSRHAGASLAQARTVATNVFIAVEAFYLLNCRSLLAPLSEIGLRSNPWVWGGIGAMALLQLLFTYAPPMNEVFGSAPIGLAAWLRVLGVGVFTFIVVGVEKALRRRAAANSGVAKAATAAAR